MFLAIFVLVVLRLFFIGYLLAVFIDMYRFFTVTKFLYIHTLSMTVVLRLMPICPEIRAGTFVLVFYEKRFFVFSWRVEFWLLVHLVKFCQSLTHILLVFRVLFLSSNLSSIISTMVWHFSSNSNSMWVIIFESSVCTSSFWRSCLSILSLLIHSWGFLLQYLVHI